MLKVSRKRAGGIAAAAGLAGALLVAWLTPISSAAPGNTHIEVFDVEGPYEKLVDLGKPGFNAGDEVFEIQPLLDPDTGKQVGRAYTRITVIRIVSGGEDFDFILDCTVRLRGGDIVFYGAGRFSRLLGPGMDLAVTGGTGAYALARGTVNLVGAEVAGKEGGLLSFDLNTT